MNTITADVIPEAKFKIFSGLLKALEDTDGAPRLSGIASSTTRDAHGDTMLETALRDMEAAANGNMTIFLNHEYRVPEDVAGSVDRATVVQRGYDGDGNPNWDLDMDIRINRDNERAVKAWNAIKNGTKLGLSIGAMIPSGGAVRDKETGALTISRLSLLETSIVSIPANPRSWISNAVKAISLAEDDFVKASQTAISVFPSTWTTNGTNTSTTTWIVPSPDVEADEDPEITLSDDPASQEADDSDPGTEDGAAEAITAAADPDVDLGPVVHQSVQGILSLLETTTAKLVEAREEREIEKQGRLDAEKQRDEIGVLANQLFTQGHAIFDRLAETPVGRKTSFTQSREAFDDLDGIYSEQFRRLLSKEATKP